MRPSIIFNAHLDIQPAGDPSEWTHPPFSGHVDTTTNTIYGRGAMDDKAEVAICLGLLRVIVEKQLQFDGDVIFQFVLEDEITGNGSLACLEAGHVADCAIIVDGTRPDPGRSSSTRATWNSICDSNRQAGLGQRLAPRANACGDAGLDVAASQAGISSAELDKPAALERVSSLSSVRYSRSTIRRAALLGASRGESALLRDISAACVDQRHPRIPRNDRASARRSKLLPRGPELRLERLRSGAGDLPPARLYTDLSAAPVRTTGSPTFASALRPEPPTSVTSLHGGYPACSTDRGVVIILIAPMSG